MHPFVSDLAQRVLTLNKRDQKRDMARTLATMPFPEHPSVLDFGCGTGLFAQFLQQQGFRYVGYDVDMALLAYAEKRSSGATFVANLDAAATAGPFDLILANCCFHHIPDEECHNILRRFNTLLQPTGHVLFIDILRPAEHISAMHDTFMLMEQGLYVRSLEETLALFSRVGIVIQPVVTRSYCFGIQSSLNGFCNDLLTCWLRLQRHS